MMNFKFGTAINCIDGRTQEVVIDNMKQNYGVDGYFPNMAVKPLHVFVYYTITIPKTLI